MSEYRLLPRLDNLGVRRMLSQPDLLRDGSVADRMDAAARSITYAPSGGSRASAVDLAELRNGIVALALAQGFPAAGKAASKGSFDVECGQWLEEHSMVRGGEALRDDVWAFIACCVVPDVALWRFEDGHPDRFQGGVRNTFQRLWLRARALDRGAQASGRWHLHRSLSEDAAVQILERSSIGAEPMIARGIAEAWVATADRIGASRMQPVTRAAVRRIRIANQITCFGALEQADAEVLFLQYFDDAASTAR